MINNIKDKQQVIMYSQVYSILNALGNEYIKAIPEKLYNLIKDNSSQEYIKTYSMDNIWKNDELTKKTVAFLCILHYNCWCKTEEEKKKIQEILKYNCEMKRIKNILNMRENTINKNLQIENNEKMESNEKIENNDRNVSEEKSLIKHEEKWYTKIFKKIKSFFSFNKKKDDI